MQQKSWKDLIRPKRLEAEKETLTPFYGNLLAELGQDRDRFTSPQALQCLAGTAPVSFQNGQIHRVHIRRQCNRALRHALHLLAQCSRSKSAWAGAYYNTLRARGKSHACALRCLAHRWLEIIGAMCRTHTPYNAEHHLYHAQKHGSWTIQLLNTQSAPANA